MKHNCPCKECEKREMNCHGKCPDYTKWERENKAMNQKRFEDYESKFTNHPGKNKIYKATKRWGK